MYNNVIHACQRIQQKYHFQFFFHLLESVVFRINFYESYDYAENAKAFSLCLSQSTKYRHLAKALSIL